MEISRKLRGFDAMCKDVYKTGASGDVVGDIHHLSRGICIVPVRVYEDGRYFVRRLDQGSRVNDDGEGIHGGERGEQGAEVFLKGRKVL